MVLYTIDNFEIHKNKIKTNSNYDVSITVYKDGVLYSGYHEKSNVKDMDILSHFIRGIELEKTSTIEEYFSMA